MTQPLAVVHIPHSSTTIPEDVRGQFVLQPQELAAELLRMTDHLTDRLFDLPPGLARAVSFPVSPLVVDPERFEDDEHEPMARKGMGAVYTRTSDGRPLRRVPPAAHAAGREWHLLREGLLDRFYRPHHAALSAAVAAALASHGRCLLVDAHSFPSAPLPYEDDRDPDRPDVCLGTDPFHTPAWLCAAARESCAALGRVELDRPFSGALVPAPYWRRDERVLAVMLEVNRGRYLDEATGRPSAGFEETERLLQAALVRLVDAAGKTMADPDRSAPVTGTAATRTG